MDGWLHGAGSPGFIEIQPPERSEWQARLSKDVVFRPEKGGEPSWFWRRMQYLAFGIRWEKEPATKATTGK